MADKTDVPHKLEQRRGGAFALVHPDTGEELGRFFPLPGGWGVTMPDANGVLRVSAKEIFPTRYAARRFILDAHTPEAE